MKSLPSSCHKCGKPTDLINAENQPVCESEYCELELDTNPDCQLPQGFDGPDCRTDDAEIPSGDWWRGCQCGRVWEDEEDSQRRTRNAMRNIARAIDENFGPVEVKRVKITELGKEGSK